MGLKLYPCLTPTCLELNSCQGDRWCYCYCNGMGDQSFFHCYHCLCTFLYRFIPFIQREAVCQMVHTTFVWQRLKKGSCFIQLQTFGFRYKPHSIGSDSTVAYYRAKIIIAELTHPAGDEMIQGQENSEPSELEGWKVQDLRLIEMVH